jgi:hypothetical protein
MYHVKDEGKGLNGLDIIDSSSKMEEMVRKYEYSRKLILSVKASNYGFSREATCQTNLS